MARRSAGEWAGLIVALVVAGAVVSFCILLVTSFLHIPLPAAGVLAAAAIVAMAFPILRPPAPKSGRAADRSVNTPAGPPAAPARTVSPTERPAMSDAPLVGIVMGSESDRAVMEDCMATLEGFGVPYEVLVASAHRQPAMVHDWASGLAGRGVKVVIAAAGKAAHLGGVVAAYTPLPVIAVPMKTSDLGGLDSLLSMVQMPSGVPVACVAINGAKNAAILATQVLGTSMPEYRAAIERMKSDLAL
jgi:5-(carboxyamino)imidazole ribonucleotide mutase